MAQKAGNSTKSLKRRENPYRGCCTISTSICRIQTHSSLISILLVLFLSPCRIMVNKELKFCNSQVIVLSLLFYLGMWVGFRGGGRGKLISNHRSLLHTVCFKLYANVYWNSKIFKWKNSPLSSCLFLFSRGTNVPSAFATTSDFVFAYCILW